MFLNILVLTACSKGPTESEAKKIIQSVVDTCPYATLEKFDKTNAVAVGDGNNFYDVIITYTIKTKVDPQAAKYAEEDAKIKAQKTKIQSDLEKQLAENKALRKFYREKKREVEDDAIRNKLDETWGEIDYQINKLWHDFGRHPKTDSELKCGVILSFFETDFTEEVTKEFSQTIRMVKSDKGWISAK